MVRIGNVSLQLGVRITGERGKRRWREDMDEKNKGREQEKERATFGDKKIAIMYTHQTSHIGGYHANYGIIL